MAAAQLFRCLAVSQQAVATPQLNALDASDRSKAVSHSSGLHGSCESFRLSHHLAPNPVHTRTSDLPQSHSRHRLQLELLILLLVPRRRNRVALPCSTHFGRKSIEEGLASASGSVLRYVKLTERIVATWAFHAAPCALHTALEGGRSVRIPPAFDQQSEKATLAPMHRRHL